MQISAFILMDGDWFNDECSFDRHRYVRNWFLFGADGFCFVGMNGVNMSFPCSALHQFSHLLTMLVSFPIPFQMYFYLNFQTETAYRVRSTVVHIETNISNTNWWKYRLISNPYHECIKIMMMMSLLLILYKTWWYSPKFRENKNRKQFIKNNKQCST